MLSLKNIVNNFEDVKNKLQKRGFDVGIIDSVWALAKSRSTLMTKLQHLESQRNKISRKIGVLKNRGTNGQVLRQQVTKIKSDIEQMKQDEQKVNEAINHRLLRIPNMPLDFVPIGKDETANVIIREHVFGRSKITNVQSHYEFGLSKGIIDVARAVKLAGSRFWIYQKAGARLVRALQSFMIDEHVIKGYEEIMPPLMVNGAIMQGSGQLPKFKEDLFKIAGRDAYLIPTAEVPLVNLYANEIIDLSKPKMLTAFTPCFRAEAGSGGKDTKGLIRAHQFYKVEVVKITKKEDLEHEFNKTLDDCKNILEKLQLPYQELMLCTSDLSFASERTIDLEIWIPSENRYREVSSISSCGDFQGRRAKIRYKDNEGKNQYAYTINGSGLAIDRVIAAILEMYQNKDGSLLIPQVLVPYFGKRNL